MNELSKTKLQTPIEIALGIDENGMTTASKLFVFLGMSKNNYSRWFRNNISNNEFAEENVDYFMLLTKEDQCKVRSSQKRNEKYQPNPSQDAKLTARFAKKLSMMAKNERGEQAREYFTRVEDLAFKATERLSKMSNNPMELLKLHYEAIKQVDEKVDTLEDRFNRLEADMPVFTIDTKNIQSAVRKKGIEVLGGKESNAYKNKSTRTYVYSDIQCMLRRNFGVKRYEEIRHKQADIALKLIENYTPPLFLQSKVDMENSQISFIFN